MRAAYGIWAEKLSELSALCASAKASATREVVQKMPCILRLVKI